MTNSNKWGVGNKKDAKPYDRVLLGEKEVDLIFGEHKHSFIDNNSYVRLDDKNIYPFDGHRRCFSIHIDESNYLKESQISGDQVRKTCEVKVFINSKQCFEGHHRNYEGAYKKAQRFIESIEMLDWYPFNTQKVIGKVIGYKEQLFKIESVIIDQGCMILVTLDGEKRKPFLWEDREDYENDTDDSIKVEVNCPHITWFIGDWSE